MPIHCRKAFDIYVSGICQPEVVLRSRRNAVTPFFPRRTTTTLYLGSEQHARQLTISLRDERGDVLQEHERLNEMIPTINPEILKLIDLLADAE